MTTRKPNPEMMKRATVVLIRDFVAMCHFGKPECHRSHSRGRHGRQQGKESHDVLLLGSIKALILLRMTVILRWINKPRFVKEGINGDRLRRPVSRTRLGKVTELFTAGARHDCQAEKIVSLPIQKSRPSQRETSIRSMGWHRPGMVLAVLAMLPFLFLSFTGAEGVIWGIIFIGLAVAASIYALVRLYGRIIASLSSQHVAPNAVEPEAFRLPPCRALPQRELFD